MTIREKLRALRHLREDLAHVVADALEGTTMRLELHQLGWPTVKDLGRAWADAEVRAARATELLRRHTMDYGPNGECPIDCSCSHRQAQAFLKEDTNR